MLLPQDVKNAMELELVPADSVEPHFHAQDVIQDKAIVKNATELEQTIVKEKLVLNAKLEKEWITKVAAVQILTELHDKYWY